VAFGVIQLGWIQAPAPSVLSGTLLADPALPLAGARAATNPSAVDSSYWKNSFGKLANEEGKSGSHHDRCRKRHHGMIIETIAIFFL